MSRPQSTHLTTRRLRPLIAVLGICSSGLAAVGCGGGDDAPTRSLRLDAAADGSLRFEREAVTTSAGRVSIEMANPSDIPHAIALRGPGADAPGETVGNGETSRFEAELEPGTYTLVCPVAGHEEAGMVADLTVR